MVLSQGLKPSFQAKKITCGKIFACGYAQNMAPLGNGILLILSYMSLNKVKPSIGRDAKDKQGAGTQYQQTSA